VFVVPGRRRSGVGRALKTVMMEHGRALGAERVEAFLSAANVASAELKLALGFRLRPSGPGDPPESRGLLVAEANLGAAPTFGRSAKVTVPLEAGSGADATR
jgi:GNAT superfamily N-acetyltransferase